MKPIAGDGSKRVDSIVWKSSLLGVKMGTGFPLLG